jgi:stalled ribosome alternative rescue factor ArfA
MDFTKMSIEELRKAKASYHRKAIHPAKGKSGDYYYAKLWDINKELENRKSGKTTV